MVSFNLNNVLLYLSIILTLGIEGDSVRLQYHVVLKAQFLKVGHGYLPLIHKG